MNKKNKRDKKDKMLKVKYLIIFLLVGLAAAGGFWWTKNNLTKGKDGAVRNLAATPTAVPTTKPVPSYPKTIGDFLITDKEICQENSKPVVYFFGSSGCSHCVWEKPIMEKVAQKFGKEIDFHENIDTQTDSDVFAKYSDINPGYVPFMILGCKYARVGAGENLGKDEAESKKLEEEALTAVICKLTEGKPNSVCAAIKDKVSEIK